MIILLYLIVIFGWALLILVIKCRKAREKRIAMAQQEGKSLHNSILHKCLNEIPFQLKPRTLFTWYRLATRSTMSFPSRIHQHRLHAVTIIRTAVEAITSETQTPIQVSTLTLTPTRRLYSTKEFSPVVSLFDVNRWSVDKLQSRFRSTCRPRSAAELWWSHQTAQPVSETQLNSGHASYREPSADHRRNRSQRSLHHHHHVIIAFGHHKSAEKQRTPSFSDVT